MKWVLFSAVASLAACAAIGPTSAPEFPALVAAAVPKAEGQVHILGSGTWYPNTRGFAPLRSTLLARPADPIPGAVAVTENSIVFAQWDEASRKFEPMKQIRYADMESATLDQFGLGRRLVIRTRDLSVDSFEFTQAGGNLVDAQKTERAVHFIQSRVGRKDG
jgi:hypothetical protein